MALAPNALFRSDLTMLEPPQNRLSPSQIWPLENPVGTEQVRPQYLTNPDADVVPGVMWGDRMTSPRVAGGLNSAMDIGMGFAGSTGPGGIRAYHGSPHSFDRFDNTKIGTGVGAQPYGHGHYLAANEDVARIWRGRDGHMYETNIKAEPQQMLDWDKPFSAQGDAGKAAHDVSRELLAQAYQKTSGGSAEFAEKLMSTGGGLGKSFSKDMTPGDAILWAQAAGVDPAAISQALRAKGIPGLKYSDAAVAGGPANKNYVVFDDATIEILRKYGLAGLMLGGGAAAGAQGQ
jgi:hypothetical protein